MTFSPGTSLRELFCGRGTSVWSRIARVSASPHPRGGFHTIPNQNVSKESPAMGSIKKKRRAKMSKHKHDKRIKLERHKNR